MARVAASQPSDRDAWAGRVPVAAWLVGGARRAGADDGANELRCAAAACPRQQGRQGPHRRGKLPPPPLSAPFIRPIYTDTSQTRFLDSRAKT